MTTEGVGTRHAFAISRHEAPEVCQKLAPSNKRAQGRPGARCTRGLVCNMHKKTHTSIQVQRRHPGLPCAMVLRLTSCSPWRPGFLATIIREKLASHELDASVGASEPHDFAVRDRPRSSHAALASTASHRAFVTCATPLSSGGTGQASSADLPDALSGIFLREGVDRFC
jgi:hypothetical protein